MHLTREEKLILSGEMGPIKARALEVIVRVGEALGAERLVRIKHAHISGVSYANIGDAGAELIESFSGERFAVPATVNPIGFDLDKPEAFGVDDRFMEGQRRILRALKRMGARLILSCTPYEIPGALDPGLSTGDHVAWGESSAVLYANSVLGLRTNREGGPIALMAALVGRTYYYGLHVPENRVPSIEYIVPGEATRDEALAGVTGEIIAGMHGDQKPPRIKGARPWSKSSLKALLAALGSAGAIGMAHIEGVTPEPLPGSWKPEERVSVDPSLVRSRLEELAPGDPGEVDLVFIGCPHSGEEELRRLASLVKGAGRPRIRFVVAIPRALESAPHLRALIGELRGSGIEVVRDTCIVVSRLRGRVVATNSYKTYFYLKRRGVKVYLASLDDLVALAYHGGA